MFEGENIAQIRWRCYTGLVGGQQLLHGSQSARARHATDINVVASTGYFHAQFERLLGALLANNTLERGEKIKLSGFGNFVVRDKNARVGRNPQTGEEITISARRVLTFKPSQVLKNILNGLPPV